LRSRIGQLFPGVLLPALGLSLVGLVVIGPTTLRSAQAASNLCVAPPQATTGAAKSIETAAGCNAAGGQVSNPASGFISIVMPAGVGAATFVDAIELLGPPPHLFYQGAYALRFSSCSGGQMRAVSYTIGAGGVYPKTAPAHSGSVSVAAGAPGGTVSCRYLLSYVPAGADQPPHGPSARNVIFVRYANGQTTQTASPSVKLFGTIGGPSPTPTPTEPPSTLTPSAPPTPDALPSPSPPSTVPVTVLAQTGASPGLLVVGWLLLTLGVLIARSANGRPA